MIMNEKIAYRDQPSIVAATSGDEKQQLSENTTSVGQLPEYMMRMHLRRQGSAAGVAKRERACGDLETLLDQGKFNDNDDDNDSMTSMHSSESKAHLKLCFVLRYHPSLDFVHRLVKHHPLLLTKADERNGWLPLHYACHNEATLDLIIFMVREYPEALQKRSSCSQAVLPLHLALQNRPRRTSRSTWIEKIEYLVTLFPESIKMPDAKGRLPLHLALEHAVVSAKLVHFLLDQYPQALLCADQDGALPLHIAVKRRLGSVLWSVLTRMITARPETLMMADANGDLPLHCALLSSSTSSLSSSLAAVEAAAEPTAVQTAAPFFSLVHFMVARAPESVVWPGRLGRLPLHCAIDGDCANLATIQLLIRVYPESLYQRDGQGRLPLDAASQL